MPAGVYSFYLDSVSEDFYWFFSVYVGRVSDTKLSILIKACREDFSTLCKKYRVELSCCSLHDTLAIEVWLVHLGSLDAIRTRVSIKNFTVLRVMVPVLTELVARVFTQAKGKAFIVHEKLMLEAQWQIFHFNLG